MKHRVLISIFATVLIIFTSCKHSPELSGPSIPPPPPPPPTAKCDPDTVYFSNDILPLITSNCAKSGCHDVISHEGGVTLTDYTSILITGEVRPFNSGDSKLYKVITDNDPEDKMPPSPNASLTSSQIGYISQWINQGALENRCDSAGCDSVIVTFTNIIQPMMQKYCIGCHGSGNPSGGISLHNYDGVVATASSGQLMGVVRQDPGYSPMPKNGNKLSNCEITQLQVWINNGKPQKKQ